MWDSYYFVQFEHKSFFNLLENFGKSTETAKNTFLVSLSTLSC